MICCAVQMNSGSSMLTALPQKGTRHASVRRHNVNFGHRAIAPNRPCACGCVAATETASGRRLSALLVRISAFNQAPEHESPSYQRRGARSIRAVLRMQEDRMRQKIVITRKVFGPARDLLFARARLHRGRTVDPSVAAATEGSHPSNIDSAGSHALPKRVINSQEAGDGLGAVAPMAKIWLA